MFYSNKNGSFKILGIFCVERTGREISELGREYAAIGFRLEGNSYFSTGGKKLYAGSGSISYIPAGCPFTRKTEGTEKIIVLHLKPLGQCDGSLQVVPDARELEPFFKRCLALWEEQDTAAHSLCMAMLYHIFAALEQAEKQDRQDLPVAIATAVRHLQTHFRDPRLTAATLAEICKVSESYFRRVYRAHYGTSPWQTILELRFQNACSLLLSGYYTPRQVAELCGFADVKYFRTAFKGRYGVSPSKYALKAHPSKTDS